MSKRLDSVRAALSDRELDAVLISNSANRRYLSGFAGSAGYLLITSKEAVLATDFRYVEQAQSQAPEFRIERIGGKLDWLPKLIAGAGARRVGFEGQDVTVAAHAAFRRAIDEAETAGGVTLVETSDLVEKLRGVKDEEEMELVERAVEIADRAFEAVAPRIRAGQREREVAWELEKAMRDGGAEATSFDIIVAAGPNGALPHHRAGETVIGHGDPIVIDMGASYSGYCSDLSRTVIVGEPDETFRKVYDTVLRAQSEAESRVRSGMTGGEVDGISRGIITEAGYGENFGHGLGHGVGLDVHELPRVAPSADDRLDDGMVFTVEPGIYVSGWGGVRIEDMVVLENGSARVLSGAHKRERVG